MEDTITCTMYSTTQSKQGPALMDFPEKLEKQIISKQLCVVLIYIECHNDSKQSARMENHQVT